MMMMMMMVMVMVMMMKMMMLPMYMLIVNGDFEYAFFLRMAHVFVGFRIWLDRPEYSYCSYSNLVHVRSTYDVGWHFFVIFLSDTAAERHTR